MDATEKGPERPNPRATAGPFSVLVFWWTRKLFWRGRRSDLTTEDMHWRREVSAARANQQPPRLTRTLVRAFWHTYAIYGLFVLFHCVVVRVAYPLFLGQVVRYFSASSAGAAQGALAAGTVSKGEALGFAGGLALATALNVLLSHHTNMGTQALGMRVRVAVSSLLINLLSNDVARFDQLFMYLHYVWVMPLQTIVITYFMWEAVGAAAFVGVGSLFLQTVPVQSYLSKLTGRLRMRVAQRTDERVRLMGEIVAGIQVIKMYAWEKPFQALIESARAREVKVLLHASYLRGVYLAFMVFSERSSLFFTLLAYVLLGHELSADKVFMLAQFFNVLQLSMAIFYPNAVQMAAEASVSVTRIEAFLLLEEQRQALVGAGADALAEPPEKAERIENSVALLAVARAGEGEGGGGGGGGGEGGVDIDRLRARWLPNAITDTLSGVTLHVPPGKLCAVIGPVGAGKAKVGGSVAYAAQEPWLFAASLRSNVVFGRAFDARRYRDVVRACALTRDMQLLPQGDKTPVGDRGAALSGGQRARVNLARAVYRDADIYLLDDPLSAVDAHVGKHLFDECICGFLSDKTRILVTHQLQYLKDADHIVIINNGRVEAQGTYASLSASRINFSALLARSESDLGEAKPPTRRPRARRHSSIASSVVSALPGFWLTPGLRLK
ncbi:Multidrug resistance-associated protein 4, partial [Gryllus bimaculatus]